MYPKHYIYQSQYMILSLGSSLQVPPHLFPRRFIFRCLFSSHLYSVRTYKLFPMGNAVLLLIYRASTPLLTVRYAYVMFTSTRPHFDLSQSQSCPKHLCIRYFRLELFSKCVRSAYLSMKRSNIRQSRDIMNTIFQRHRCDRIGKPEGQYSRRRARGCVGKRKNTISSRKTLKTRKSQNRSVLLRRNSIPTE